VTANQLDEVQTQFQAGKTAFERGEYRKAVEHLQQACALVNSGSALGGTVQTWLVTAYQATGQQQEAIALCRTLTQHPDLQTRKEGKRILYILEAPKLQTRPEWLTQIPDLGSLADKTERDHVGAQSVPSTSKRPPAATPQLKPEPVDLSQVNTEDNRFVWVALIAVLLILGGLIWLM
jgi:tetratricopeptide (TPR) repeat protein